MHFICKIGFFTSFRNKSLMFVVINYVLTVNLLLCNYAEASSRVCRKLKHGIEDNLRYESVQDIGTNQCPPTTAPFSVYKVATVENSNEDKLLLVCWVKDIKRFALQFENSVQIHDAISGPGVQTRTCVNKNDSVVYHRKKKYNASFRVLLKFPAAKRVPFVFRAYYSHKNNGTYYGHYRVLQYKDSGDPQLHTKRRRREIESPITPSSECGSTRSCFRNGEDGCTHFTCTYFLSYNTTDNKVIDIELSAKTNGWVAVGFSSDTKMGGDEVIVCRKTRKDGVKSGSYKNQYSHQDPIPITGDNIVTLISVRDGYIYCHVTRPLTVRMSVHQDLSNDWYQLYAYGPLSSNGDLEKHSQRPLVSRKISMLRKSNVLTSGSEIITFPVSFTLVLLFVSSYFKDNRSL